MTFVDCVLESTPRTTDCGMSPPLGLYDRQGLTTSTHPETMGGWQRRPPVADPGAQWRLLGGTSRARPADSPAKRFRREVLFAALGSQRCSHQEPVRPPRGCRP